MSDPFNDDELDRQLATRLASRGWTVTPPKGAKPPPAPRPDIQIGLLAARTEIPFSDIQFAGGWGDMEASVTKSVKHAHMAELSRMHILDRALSWRGWHKDNTIEHMIGLTVLPYIENYNPEKHKHWGPPCVISVPVPHAGTLNRASAQAIQAATNTAPYSASRLQARFDQLKEEQARLNTYNTVKAEMEQRKKEFREKYGNQQLGLASFAPDHDHTTTTAIPKPGKP